MFPGGAAIPNDDMGRLHKEGFAQDSDVRGSSGTYSQDLNSGSFQPPG